MKLTVEISEEKIEVLRDWAEVKGLTVNQVVNFALLEPLRAFLEGQRSGIDRLASRFGGYADQERRARDEQVRCEQDAETRIR